MSEFKLIEIDLDIYKLIEKGRKNFSETSNDILRNILNLPHKKKAPILTTSVRSWSASGVILPHGTLIRMKYNGRVFEGQIFDGNWLIGKEAFTSPSGAASGVALTKSGKNTKLDGWMYWEVKVPGSDNWILLNALRASQYSHLFKSTS